ncbi:hypothetical protein ACQY1Q_17360 [Tenacibaculum sp. TC6]|uniref:hypothetical protein n=1 Tax=Tenacibaculum sp. TC6 TaxID=3423223 RepID=UPI003D36E642
MKYLILYTVFFINTSCFSQERKKDTLFIMYNDSLLTKKSHPIEHYKYYLVNGIRGLSASVYFVEKEIYTDINPIKTVDFVEVLNNSKSYHKNGDIKAYNLYLYLETRTLFLVLDDKKIVSVRPVYEIE